MRPALRSLCVCVTILGRKIADPIGVAKGISLSPALKLILPGKSLAGEREQSAEQATIFSTKNPDALTLKDAPVDTP